MFVELEMARYRLLNHRTSNSSGDMERVFIHLRRAQDIGRSSSNEYVNWLTLRRDALRYLSVINWHEDKKRNASLRLNASFEFAELEETDFRLIVKEAHDIVAAQPYLLPLYHLFTLEELVELYKKRSKDPKIFGHLLDRLGHMLDETIGREEANCFVMKLLKEVIRYTMDESQPLHSAYDTIGCWCLEYLQKAGIRDEETISEVLKMRDKLASDGQAQEQLPQTREALCQWSD